MTYNKIYVSFGALRKITGPFISYQYDVQQILVINGLNLPEYYEVDFCNEGDTYTETIVGTVDGGVAIPNKFLRTGKKVKAYLVLVGDGDVQTRYEITLPVNVRPQRQDIDPTDDQQLQIDSLIAALNSGVASAEAAAQRAEDASVHTPQIVDRYWYLWDTDTEQYVTSGVKAEGIDGDDGVGISSVRLNSDYTLTLVFTDESEYTTPVPIRGPKGDPFRYEDFTEAQKDELVQGPILDAQTAAVDAVNAAGTTQTGNVNQAGTTNVNAVNQAGTTQVNAVNQAGATQVQAVEDKGDEVLDSIPQDYTDLVDDVADLSRHLNDITEDARTNQLLDADNPNLVSGTVNAQRTIVASANSIVYIPIESGKDYCVSRQQKISRFVVYPFANQPAVGETAGTSWASPTDYGDGDYVTVTKSLVSYYGANYLAVYFRHNSIDSAYTVKELLDNLKIEVGLTPTPGTAYWKKQIKTSALDLDDVIDPESDNAVKNRAIASALSKDYSIFDQMYIKDQSVICNGDHGDATVAKYIQTTLDGQVKKIMCRAKFAANCKNGTLPGGANVAIIIAQTDRQYPIQTITKGSIHVVFNKNYFSIGVYDENGLSDLEASNTGRYYQSGTGMTDSGMEFDGTTEYEFGFEFTGENTVRVYKPNGTYLDVTDASLSTYHGNIAIWEMYVKKSTLTEWGSPEFTGFYASSNTASSIRDNFKRFDGALEVAPTGHVYKCYRNSYTGDTIYDSSNQTI